jgi:tripartite-type tricarboxylate transporter receptor subunit TctC
MKLPRRQFLRLAACAAALPTVPRIARAQAYPTRPVRIVIGFPAGGAADIATRLIGQALSGRFGQPFIVENRPGAASNLATEVVVRAPADGYTLLTATTNNTINGSLYEKLNFNFVRDITMVAGIISSPLVLEVHPSLPVSSVPELIAYAKAKPGQISLASYGVGTTSHVAGELFKMMAGINMLHVPYRGSAPMITDLLGGQVQAAVDNLPASIEHIKAGKLRALAVATVTRLESLPEIPTVAEFLPGFEARAWAAIAAPKNTPTQIVDKLNSEVNDALRDTRIRGRVAELGGTVFSVSPSDLGRIVFGETEKWGKVIRAANIKPE